MGAWRTWLRPGDVVALDEDKILLVATGSSMSGLNGSSVQISIHCPKSVTIKKNGGRDMVLATQEGFGPNDKTGE